MHVYVWEHIVRLYCRTAEWMFTKLSPGESFLTLKNDPGSHFSMGSLFTVTPEHIIV